MSANVTEPGPLTCDHKNVKLAAGLESPALPFNAAAAGRVIVWFAPAFTTGGVEPGVGVGVGVGVGFAGPEEDGAAELVGGGAEVAELRVTPPHLARTRASSRAIAAQQSWRFRLPASWRALFLKKVAK